MQGRDFDDYGDIKWKLEATIPQENIRPDQLLQYGDILFSCKWTRNIATLYKEDYWLCVASSTFFIVRIQDSNILPEYLAIVLNEAQKSPYFKNNFSGSTIQSIPKNILEDYKIPIPTLEHQQKIIGLYELHKEQLKIYDDLKLKKSQLINGLILS